MVLATKEAVLEPPGEEAGEEACELAGGELAGAEEAGHADNHSGFCLQRVK